LEVCGGVLAEDCARQLSDFFKKRRAEQKALKLQKNAEQTEMTQPQISATADTGDAAS
jgi:tRNA(adenine34) deaminase